MPARATLLKLRKRYEAVWSRPWPFDNQYLIELWLEARAGSRAQVPSPAVWQFCLELMRESHEF